MHSATANTPMIAPRSVIVTRATLSLPTELINHPLLRIARLKYAERSVEQNLVIRFFNPRCIVEGFESEVDYFSSGLVLAQWLRDAQEWASALLREEPDTCATMFADSGAEAIATVRRLFSKRDGRRFEKSGHL